MTTQVENLKVYMPVTATLPDPARIKNTGQWYVLGHISSGLSQFDHIDGKFKSLLADYEIYSSGVHSFTLKQNAKFSDGTLITAQDVVNSIKRLLIKKTSTHFPLWDYIEDCDHLKSLEDECSGLKAVSQKRIDIRLKKEAESFLLQMSSPETGIWFAGDIDSKKLDINPTKYSGPYRVDKITDTGFNLVRNEENPISQAFPSSPKFIQIKTMAADKVMAELERGGIDIAIRSHNPYDSTPLDKLGVDIFRSAPATLLYLHAVGKSSKNLIPREYLQTLWDTNTDKGIVAADNFLPFDPGLALTRTEYLAELPKVSDLKVSKMRVGVPWTYLSKGFYDFLKDAGKKSGITVEIVELTRDEWSSSLEKGDAPQEIDFVLGVYAASERYPAVQLRYITGEVRGPKIDLTQAETPELSPEKKEILRDYQKDLLKNQYAVPLFLSCHQMMYKKNLSVGDQPPADAEVELWRITKR
ncbi:MAG TPA: ABC transporter substrate-binding protein [Bdellovibrio sp.]|uniref:ABC transporter substrate-binding protein n=1 Tax=Bdellovibrio sp. TaxID=28201 RepID=UPI002EE50F37